MSAGGAPSRQRRRQRRSAGKAGLAQGGIVKPRGPRFTIVPDPVEVVIPLVASASGKTDLPLSERDAPWDAAAAEKTLGKGQYGDAHFWRDPDGDAETLAAYKLPFATADGGTLTAVWKGVTACAAALQGSRGGVDLPSADVAAVKAKVAAYYRAAAKKYDDDGIQPPWQASAEASVDFAEQRGLDVYYATDGDPTNDEGRYVGMGGDFNPVELVEVQTAAAAQCLAYAELGPGTPSADDETVGREQAEYVGRVRYWEAELKTPQRRATDALAAVAEFATTGVALQHGMPCECGHGFAEHLGSDGPCTYTDGRGECSCEGFSEKALEAAAGPRLLLTDVEVVVADAALPAEHQPAETLPPRAPTAVADPPAEPAPSRGELRWTATLMLEGVLTDDGRCFAPGSITWRDLPLTLMGMVETSEAGHQGAIVSGRIDQVWREGNLVKGSGVFDGGEFGQEIARMVGDGTLRGVSVDTAVHSYEYGPKSDFFDDDGNWRTEPLEAADDEEPNLLDILFGGEEEQVIFVVTEGVIGAATVCPFPAFADAEIALAASLIAGAAAAPNVWTHTAQAGWVVVRAPEPDAPASLVDLGALAARPPEADGHLTASAAGLAPVAPPAEWFEDPGFAELTALTVDDEGRISGHAWAWDTCHTGFPDVCTVAPHTAADYRYFHLGEVECEGGERVACGKITLDTGHADRQLGQRATVAHYDDTGTVAAHVVVGEDEFGGWVSGALHSEVDADKARLLRGAVLSGDWRRVEGNLELVALLAVNVPGFPVPRGAAAGLVAGADGTEVTALVAAGIHAGSTDAERLSKVAALGLRASPRLLELAARARGTAE